jgi:hypothetical protein
MHAVVVNLTITDIQAAEKALHEHLVPRVSQADSSRATGPPKAAARCRCSCFRPKVPPTG